MLHYLKKTLIWLIALAILLVGGFMLYVRFFPVNLTPVAERILPRIAPNLAFTFDKLWLSYDGKFTLSAQNVVFEGTQTRNIGAVESLKFRLANRSLLMLNPSPKHIVVHGVHYRGRVREVGPPMAPDQQAAQPKNDMLKKIAALLARLEHLNSIELEDINVIVGDAQTATRWALKNGIGQGTYYDGEGLNIKLQGGLAQNDEKLTPADITLKTDPDTQASILNVNLTRLNTSWFRTYLPAPMRDIFSADLALTLGTEWHPKNGWQPVNFTTRLSDLTVNLPAVYRVTQAFDSAQIKGHYLPDRDTLDLTEFALKKAGLDVNLSGQISRLRQNQQLRLQGTLNAASATDVWGMLPDMRMEKTISWLTKNISATMVAPAQVTMNGPLHTFLRCKLNAPCPGFNLSAKLASGSSITPLVAAPQLVATSVGDFKIQNGQININLPTASMGKQTAKNVSVTLANVQTAPENPRILSVQSTLSGELATALPIVKNLFKLNLAQNLAGSHESKFTFTLPFRKGVPPQIKEATLTVVVTTPDATLVGGLAGKPLQFKNTTVTLQENKLNAKGGLTYADTTGDFTAAYNLNTHNASANLNSSTDLAALPIKLPDNITLSGRAPLTLKVARQSKTAPITLALKADLRQTSAAIPKLNWAHATGNPLNLTLEGTWNSAQQALNAELFTLLGANTEVAGNFYYPVGAPISAVTLQASPLILGKSNTNIEYRANKLNITGKSLDLSQAITAPSSGKKINWPSTIDSTIKLDRLWLPKGSAQNLELRATRQNNRWQTVELTGQLPTLAVFNLNYTPLENGYQFQARADDLGGLLSALGSTDKVRGGRLIGQLNLNENHNGGGTFTLNNTQFINAPILVQLVSLLSLEQLLSNNKGIQFTEGVFPITKTGGSYRVNAAHLKGPSMALKANGEIIPADKYLNLDGQFAPTAGINRAISSIPILGDLLTGSQEGLIVADFKVKGAWNKPDVSVKPLSAITPGIVKDFLNILTAKPKVSPDMKKPEEQ